MSSIPDLALESSQGDENLNKRKRDVEDGGDRDQKKVHLEDSRLSIEDLHVDVGKKYLLCRTRKTPLQLDQPSILGFVSLLGLVPSIVFLSWFFHVNMTYLQPMFAKVQTPQQTYSSSMVSPIWQHQLHGQRQRILKANVSERHTRVSSSI